MEENNDNIEKDVISFKNISNDKLLNQATLRDLILFKEEILKEIRQYFSKMKTSLSDKFNKFVEAANEKLPINPEESAGLFMKNIKFIEEKNNIMSTISQKETNLNEKIMVNDLHINNCQKELNDAVFKYDRAILDNLLIPGLVGKGCKFLNFREYMVNVQGQINDAFSKLEFNLNNININKKNFEEQITQANTKIKNLEYELKQFIFEKNLVLENKTKQDMETMNKSIIELTGEFYKNNVELKNQIESLRNTEKIITEENRKINYRTITEFEVIKKGYKYMKKAIIDLGKLLMLSDKRTNKNKNFAANKQLVIEQFNNMMMSLVKDVKKEQTAPQPKEIQTQKSNHSKKPVSVIKQYIEGKIHAEDMEEKKEKKKSNINKDKENEEIFARNPLKRRTNLANNKNDESNSSKLNLNNINNKTGTSFEKYKKFSRHASVEYKDNIKQNSLGNNNESDSKKNDNINNNYNNNYNSNNILGEANKSHQFPIIKEEKNNISNSDEDSLFADLEEDFKNLKLNEQANILGYKGYENKKFDEENSLNIDNSLNKSRKVNKNKMFFRATTTNYDNVLSKKNVNFNQNPDNFKLLLKAQENLKKKNLERLNSLKKDSGLSQDKNYEKKTSQKKLNYIDNINTNKYKTTEKKVNNITDNYSQNNINSFIQDSSRLEKKSSNNKTEEIIKKKSSENKINKMNYNINNTNDIIIEKKEIFEKTNKETIKEIKSDSNYKVDKENKNNEEIKIENDRRSKKEVNKEENKINSIEKINNFPKEKTFLNYKLKDKLENENVIMTQNNENNKNKINIFNNNFTKTQYGYKIKTPMNKRKNLSPENNTLKLAKIDNNKENKENVKREINLSANIKNKHHGIIAKFSTHNNFSKTSILNLKTMNKPLNSIREDLMKNDNKFKIKRSYNLLNEDIFVDKEEMKKMSYYKDKDIIDKPLIVNQVNFKVQNLKGSVEDKLIELEYFTKKKFDELVREIKNFIPIHFNAYVKEF